MAKLSDFMVSRVRVKLYEIFFSDPQEMYYVRQLTRKAGEEINAIRRELSRMDKKGLLKKEKRGNRLYYYLDPEYPYFEDLLSLVVKSQGLGLDLLQNQTKLGKIKLVMLSGRFVRKLVRQGNEVDLLVVGDVVLPELNLIIQKEEKSRNVEINYTVMSAEEFEFRKNRRDPFLNQILLGSRIMVIGNQLDLVVRNEEANA
jgi:DNA-binding transcriptional ArsR family regulator